MLRGIGRRRIVACDADVIHNVWGSRQAFLIAEKNQIFRFIQDNGILLAVVGT
jgi:hypothetical protein